MGPPSEARRSGIPVPNPATPATDVWINSLRFSILKFLLVNPDFSVLIVLRTVSFVKDTGRIRVSQYAFSSGTGVAEKPSVGFHGERRGAAIKRCV
jgi:hypothetical protein